MNAVRSWPRHTARLTIIVLLAALLQQLSPAGATLARPPKDFPKATLVGGSLLDGEVKGKGVLLHAGWIDAEGNPQKWFRRQRLYPWPDPVTVDTSAFRIRLDGVTYPGNLEVGVFRRTGLNDSPSGPRRIYTCPAVPTQDAKCRWIPNVEDGRPVWDVEIDHIQDSGHLYVVAVGTWDDPDDLPRPVGTRHQIGTWIFHAQMAKA
jgi:hypothetical protein